MGVSMEYIQSKDNKTIKRIISLGQRKNRQIVPKFIAQDPIFDKVDNTVNGQGVVAIVSKPKYDMESIHIDDGLYITLDGVQDPGNLGTIIRTAVAAGVKGIFLMKGTVDPFNDKTVRSTMSALHKIPLYEDITLSLLHDMVTESNMTTYVTALEHSNPYHTVRYAKRTMLVLGNEGNGVTPEVMNLCTNRIMIPMYGDMESLNVSVAAALCMYKVQEQLMP